MKDWEILSESELAHLEQSSGDDCDMAAVRCAVRELRARRAADLTEKELDALTWARAAIERSPWSVSSDCTRALAALDKLLGGNK